MLKSPNTLIGKGLSALFWIKPLTGGLRWENRASIARRTRGAKVLPLLLLVLLLILLLIKELILVLLSHYHLRLNATKNWSWLSGRRKLGLSLKLDGNCS